MSQNLFTGSLTGIVRSIMRQKRTGILFVERVGGTERGKIDFENGSPVRAYSSQEVGKAALQRISAWKEVSYTFQSRSSVNPATGPVRVPAHPQMSERESTRPARSPAASRQTGARFSSPETVHEARQTGPMRRAWYGNGEDAQGRETNPLHPRQVEIVTSAHGKMVNWQLPGSAVESTPLPSKEEGRRRAPAITRQIAEVETMLLPTWPPDPHLTPQPGGMEEALPGRDAVFQTNPAVAVVSAIQDMERRERIVFILVNGRRTIADIARLTHQTEFEVEQTLIKLTQRGYTHRIRS